jgi:starch synthase
MAYALPKALIRLGHDVRVITPYYESIKRHHDRMTFLASREVNMGGTRTSVNYYTLKEDDITYIFVQNIHYFERPRLYGYSDDAERFTCFSYAVLDVMDAIGFYPQILHLNDWQTGMIPYLLDSHYRQKNDRYFSVHTLLSIHNLEYQGSFDTYVSRFFNTSFDYTYIHFDRVNFLKAGIERASRINTVSPTYRDEIMTPDGGFSLDGALEKRRDHLSGILNGIDTELFDPRHDPHLPLTYGITDVKKGKRANKAAVLKRFGLEDDHEAPLVSYIGRLASQKGISLMTRALEEVVNYSESRFILLGSGNDTYEDFFRYLAGRFPGKVANFIGFDEAVAHQLYAASDIFMMPSRFEPCGLGQMIAMRYGALPVVRETGGLKDTVIPYNKFTGQGTGFSFAHYDPYDFKEKLFEAINLYHNQTDMWDGLVRNAMKTDFSQKKMAESYETLYQIILGA